MVEPVRILLADDHLVVRQGIRLVLESEPDLAVICEASTGAEAVAFVAEHRPNVVLMDLAMPDLSGLDATLQIKQRFPEVQVLVLTLHDGEEYLIPLLRAGASGYVLKGGHNHELLVAIRTVAKGGVFLSANLAKRLVSDYLRVVVGS